MFQQIKNPKPILHETSETEFKLGMNIIFKDGTGKSEHVVYKGATANGLKHVVICIDGSQSNVDQSHLSFINQIGFENIPQTPFNHCKEVGNGITQEQAQRFACPRVLTHLDSSTTRTDELTSLPLSLAIK